MPGGRGEIAVATETGANINLLRDMGTLESATQILTATHIPGMYEESPQRRHTSRYMKGNSSRHPHHRDSLPV